MKNFLFTVLISLCVEVHVYIHRYIYVCVCICCSVPTEVIVKLLPSVLVCFSSLTTSSILPVWTLLRPRLELSESRTRKGRENTADKVFEIRLVCRLGKEKVQSGKAEHCLCEALWCGSFSPDCCCWSWKWNY